MTSSAESGEPLVCAACGEEVECRACARTLSLGEPLMPGAPMVVYGSLRRGELAHHQIGDPEQATRFAAGKLDGYQLVIDDGLPFAQAAGYGVIDVDVVWLTDAGYETVRAFEPAKLYKWALCEAVVDGLPVSANVLVPARRLSAHAEHMTGRWVSAQDPLLLTGLVAVRELAMETVAAHPASVIHSPVQDVAFWVAYMRTEAAYLLLWSVLERYAALRYGPALDPERKIALLGAEDVFKRCAVMAAVPVGRRVRDTRGARGPGAIQGDGSNAGKYFRQIRNNIAHRGKAAYNETHLLAEALVYCFNTARLLLLETVPSLKEEWERVSPGGGLEALLWSDLEPLFG